MQFRRSSRASSEPTIGHAPVGPGRRFVRPSTTSRRALTAVFLVLAISLCSGCYVPLRTAATPANSLPDLFRTPSAKSLFHDQNLAALVVPQPQDYSLGPDDELNVTVRGLSDTDEIVPTLVQVMGNGTVRLPLIGEVNVEGKNLAAAQEAIDQAYRDGVLVNPRVSVSLARKATVDVTVLGEVTTPGVYELPRYENDVAHAIGLAGGLTDFHDDVVKIHRRVKDPRQAEQRPTTLGGAEASWQAEWMEVMIEIPLRGGKPSMIADGNVVVKDNLTPDDVTLRQGDVISVPKKPDPVFFVVGPLSGINAVNFTVSDRDRQLGNAFILPDDRDIDVVTAVAMAGYIDPIESPSTVTVHRSVPGAQPMLIHVDLIDARYSWQENIYVRPGDIIYLNPDPSWWWRRTFDRIVPELITIPYGEAMANWLNPFVAN